VDRCIVNVSVQFSPVYWLENFYFFFSKKWLYKNLYWGTRDRFLVTVPSTWLMTAASSATPASQDNAWLTLVRFSSVGRACIIFGDRAFGIAEPRLMNNLTSNHGKILDLLYNQFRRRLNTLYFGSRTMCRYELCLTALTVKAFLGLLTYTLTSERVFDFRFDSVVMHRTRIT